MTFMFLSDTNTAHREMITQPRTINSAQTVDAVVPPLLGLSTCHILPATIGDRGVGLFNFTKAAISIMFAIVLFRKLSMGSASRGTQVNLNILTFMTRKTRFRVNRSCRPNLTVIFAQH